jgi:ADP-ribose pyrophosphatase YjhB (NUDIX family)
MSEDTFYVSNKACVLNDDKVLLLKTHEEEWELPGGHLEHGEGITSSLARELREETGCDVENLSLVTASTNSDAFPDDDYVTLFWRGSCDGRVTISDEHTDHAWVSRHRLSSYSLKHGAVLRDLIVRVVDW